MASSTPRSSAWPALLHAPSRHAAPPRHTTAQSRARALVDAAAEHGVACWTEYTPEQLLAINPEVIVTKHCMRAELCLLLGLDQLRDCRDPRGLTEVDNELLDDSGLPMLDAAEALFDAVYPRAREESAAGIRINQTAK